MSASSYPPLGVPSPANGGGSGRGAPNFGRVHGVAEIAFGRRDGASRLAHLYQRDPLRVLFPGSEAGELPQAVIATTSGGLVAGDQLSITVEVRAGAAAHVTASAAEKIYRSNGKTTEITQFLRVEGHGWLEYLPPEAILFDGARLRRHTVVRLNGGGFLGGGIVVFGRRAHGERFTHGLLHERWEVIRAGTLIWGDALHLDGNVAAIMAHPACFAGAAACATLVLVPAGHEPRTLIDAARAVQERSSAPGLRFGVTVVNGALVARWLGPDPLALRSGYADLACHLRAAAMGLAPRLPRLWHV